MNKSKENKVNQICTNKAQRRKTNKTEQFFISKNLHW